MAWTLGSNSTGYSYVGASTFRGGAPTLWDEAVWEVVKDNLILEPLVGQEGSGMPFITKTEFKKTRTGDTITLEMDGNMSGLGKWGNKTLEENEEAIPSYYVDINVNQLRNAWVDEGELSRTIARHDLKRRGVKKLGRWFAEQVERYLFNALYYGFPPFILGDLTLKGYNINSGVMKPCKNWKCADGANNDPTYHATNSTYITNIQTAEALLANATSDYFSPSSLEGIISFLKTSNFMLVNKNGWKGWIGIIHPYQTAQLRQNDTWFQANIHAMPVGADNNPVFKGGIASDIIGRWGNILLMESNYIHAGDQDFYTALISTATGSNVVEIDSSAPAVRRALFLGGEACAIGESVTPHLVEKGDFDYFNREGVAISGILGMRRADFKSDDGNDTIINQSTLVFSTYSPSTPY